MAGSLGAVPGVQGALGVAAEGEHRAEVDQRSGSHGVIGGVTGDGGRALEDLDGAVHLPSVHSERSVGQPCACQAGRVSLGEVDRASRSPLGPFVVAGGGERGAQGALGVDGGVLVVEVLGGFGHLRPQARASSHRPVYASVQNRWSWMRAEATVGWDVISIVLAMWRHVGAGHDHPGRGGDESVADAVHRHQVTRFRWDGLDLRPQASHREIDGPTGGGDLVPEDLAHEIFASHVLPRSDLEELQQTHLLVGELRRALTPSHDAARQVDLTVQQPDGAAGGSRCVYRAQLLRPAYRRGGIAALGAPPIGRTVMRKLSSYLEGRWVEGDAPGAELTDATTGAPVATASTRGLDLGAAMGWARTTGGSALRALSFAQRGEALKALSEVIHSHRDELIDLSRLNAGTTRGDAKFDIDGAAGTLGWYAYLGSKMGDARWVVDGEPERILRSKRFVGQHLWVPRHGVAVHINAFNFPAWGMAEKAAVAWLAGVPVVTKPATATALLAHRIVELWAESGVLPEGALSLVCGSVGDLLDHVGPQDCLAFTGGSATARVVRGHPQVVAHNVRVNIEADSLNASVLGPDVQPGSDTFQMFVQDAVRDMTQKAGQKCTAVRRIFVPSVVADAAIEALTERLSGVVTGDPATKGTDVGPLSSASQQRSVRDGLAELERGCRLVWRGDAPDQGFFVTPSLFATDAGVDAPFVHEHEVFGPCATVLTYDGSADAAVAGVAAGGGGLVASVYSDDLGWAGPVVLGLAPWSGRVHWGSRKVTDQSPGPGTVLPNLVHGGPGKAGGGEELGGARGLQFYWQRTAIQGDRGLLERVLGTTETA